MKKITLLALATIAMSTPSIAKTHRHHHFYREISRDRVDHRQASRHRVNKESHASTHPQITCEMVRAYVAQVGLVQAKAMALSEGITASEERRAMRCLEKKI
jgi:hypothetical protein